MINKPILSTNVEPLAPRRRAVAEIYPRMFRNLSTLFHHDLSRTKLLQFIHLVARRKGAIIDRAAKRSREGMLCWLCETAPELAKPKDDTLIPNTNSIEEADASEELKDDLPFDIVTIGFDDLRKEEARLLLTLD
jgi:hypothetical protein